MGFAAPAVQAALAATGGDVEAAVQRLLGGGEKKRMLEGLRVNMEKLQRLGRAEAAPRPDCFMVCKGFGWP